MTTEFAKSAAEGGSIQPLPQAAGESRAEFLARIEREGQTRLLTKAELAQYFSVTPRTVEAWMAAGHLVFFRIGHTVRFRLADVLDRLKRNHRVN